MKSIFNMFRSNLKHLPKTFFSIFTFKLLERIKYWTVLYTNQNEKKETDFLRNSKFLTKYLRLRCRVFVLISCHALFPLFFLLSNEIFTEIQEMF